MKKSIYQVINESLAGKTYDLPINSANDSRSVLQIANEGIAEVNYLISESALTLSDMNEDLISAVLMNETATAESLNEGVIKSVGEGIRKFFAMIKRTIDTIIGKIKLMIDSNRKNGAQLVSTYGSRVKGTSTDGIEIKGYKYIDKYKNWVTTGDDEVVTEIDGKVDNLDTTLNTLRTAEKIEATADISDVNKGLSSATTEFNKEYVDKLKEDSSDFQDKMKVIVKKATNEDVNGKSLTDVQQELLKIGRDNQTEKVVVKAKDYNMDTIMKDLTAGNDLSVAERALSAYKKSVEATQAKFEKNIKQIESAKDTTTDSIAAANARYISTNKVTYMNAAKDYLSKIYNVNSSINSIVIKLMEEEYKQKVQLFIAVAKKSKIAKQNNSADMEDLEMEDFEF